MNRVPDQNTDDYIDSAVPLSERRGSWTMGLLWITMVTGFPTVLAGFAWYESGLSLIQAIVCSFFACFLLLFYAIPACLLGARSGLTYCLLSRKVFGSWGSCFVSFNTAAIAVCWYGLVAGFLAQGLKGIYQIDVATPLLAAGIALLMAVNNFFGFSGVANFARYVAAPVLLLWVGSTFVKASMLCPATVWAEPGTAGGAQAFALVSAYVIGVSAWGNEADYWRYSKPSKTAIALPLIVALAVGQFIFPLTGWMMARLHGVTDLAAATKVMDNFAFGGFSFLIALVLTICYFAVNDSCLFGAITAMENVTKASRGRIAAALTACGVISAALLSGGAKNFEQLASLSCVFLPSATVIIMCELFWFGRKDVGSKSELSRVPSFKQLPAVRWSAVVALLTGGAVGVITTGIVPGTQALKLGVPALQAWICCALVYAILRTTVDRRSALARGDMPVEPVVTSKEKEVVAIR